MAEYEKVYVDKHTDRKLKGFKIFLPIIEFLEDDSYKNKLSQAHIVNEILYRHYTGERLFSTERKHLDIPPPMMEDVAIKEVIENTTKDTSNIMADIIELEDWELLKFEIMAYGSTLEKASETIGHMDLGRVYYIYSKYKTEETDIQLKENNGDESEESESELIVRLQAELDYAEAQELDEETLSPPPEMLDQLEGENIDNNNSTKPIETDESEKNIGETNITPKKKMSIEEFQKIADALEEEGTFDIRKSRTKKEKPKDD